MSKLDLNASFKRLRNRYRLVVMNDDSYEEVTSFRLSRWSVYIWASTIFILLIGATIALLWFTPLKQFTPGYKQGYGVDAKYKQLKIASDSMLHVVQMQTQYIEHVKAVLQEKQLSIALDTTMLPNEVSALENVLKKEKNEK